jgi:hypothetical protein
MKPRPVVYFLSSSSPTSIVMRLKTTKLGAFVFYAFLMPLVAFFPARAIAGEKMADLGISAGWRQDDLDWDIAGTLAGTDPNVLSELKWMDLNIFYLKAELSTDIYKSLYLRSHYGYGVIYEGANRDSDYLGDDRTLEYSRSINDAGDGSVEDVSLGLGYRFSFGQKEKALFWFAPVAGYSFHAQDLTITDGFQAIPPDGPFSGLDTSYSTEWRGPWAGIDFAFGAWRLSFSGSIEYHAGSYDATADWNLRDDFLHPESFTHTADARGVRGELEADFNVSRHMSVFLEAGLQDWKAKDGIDRTFFIDGTSTDTRLNEVNWESFDAMVGFKYVY